MRKYNFYPALEIHLKQIQENAEKIVAICQKRNILVCGVVKSSEAYEYGYKSIAHAFIQGGCKSLGDSRLHTIIHMREVGVQEQILLLRPPMLSEIPEVITHVNTSLNTERKTLKRLFEEAQKQKKIHEVILMADLGDLREGYFEPQELIGDAVYVEKELCPQQDQQGGLHLLGIGTNLGCYGAIKPSVENLSKLVEIAHKIQEQIGRKLDIISGGATSTLPVLLQGKIPSEINHLRIGEGILNNRDLPDVWGEKIAELHNTNYVLHAEIIEIKEKPSHPIGEIFIDAFGNKPTFEDKGDQVRALLAIGKRDIGAVDNLLPRLEGVEVIGGSSDHLIVDITHAKEKLEVGGILTFDLTYSGMLYANHSHCIEKVYVD